MDESREPRHLDGHGGKADPHLEVSPSRRASCICLSPSASRSSRPANPRASLRPTSAPPCCDHSLGMRPGLSLCPPVVGRAPFCLSGLPLPATILFSAPFIYPLLQGPVSLGVRLFSFAPHPPSATRRLTRPFHSLLYPATGRLNSPHARSRYPARHVSHPRFYCLSRALRNEVHER